MSDESIFPSESEPPSQTSVSADGPLIGSPGCRRGDVDLRNRIAVTTVIQNQGWITHRYGGTPWTLSRTKRTADAMIALLILLVLVPIFLIIALLIKATSHGPVFFIQKRTGYRGRRFGMFKFRTMVADAEARKASLRHLNKHGPESVDFKIDDDPRITSVGRVLRKTSLDELPNLINVVRGDMRLVGPRPTSFNANTYEKNEYLRRLGVYPGVTGLWQISGRSDIGFEERVELDVRYIHDQGPLQDLKILVMTPIKILTGDGAS